MENQHGCENTLFVTCLLGITSRGEASLTPKGKCELLCLQTVAKHLGDHVSEIEKLDRHHIDDDTVSIEIGKLSHYTGIVPTTLQKRCIDNCTQTPLTTPNGETGK